MAKLIKIDRNGSKHYEGECECDRCQGRGQYWWGAMMILGNGEIKAAVNVTAHGFSKSAIAKIEAAGGKAVVIE